MKMNTLAIEETVKAYIIVTTWPFFSAMLASYAPYVDGWYVVEVGKKALLWLLFICLIWKELGWRMIYAALFTQVNETKD